MTEPVTVYERLLWEADRVNTPLTPPVDDEIGARPEDERTAADRIRAVLPGEEARPSGPEPVAEPGPETEPEEAQTPEPEPDGTPARPDSARVSKGPERATTRENALIVDYHVEALSNKGNLGVVRRVGWHVMYDYIPMHMPTRRELGIAFKDLESAHDFVNKAEDRWNWDFNSIASFFQRGIYLQDVYRLAGSYAGAVDALGSFLRKDTSTG